MAVFFDQDFSGSTVIYNSGAASETWTYDTEIGDTGSDLYTVAESFTTWANHGSRAWTGTRTFTYTLTTFGVNHGITLVVAGGGGAWTINAAMAAASLLPSGTSSALSLVGTAGVRATLSAVYGFRRRRKMKGDKGSISAGGSWQHDPMHARTLTADIFATVKQSDLYALTLATQVATTPRRAVLYDNTASVYRRMYVAEIQTTIGKRQLHGVTLTAIEVT